MSSITIRDVARHAGVGVGTVSRVLNGSPAVREGTRRKVLSSIKELDFRPNPMARRLSLGKTLTIAVIAPFFTRPSVIERLRGIEYVLADTEYDLTIYNVESPARRDACFRRVPRRERVDGLLAISLLPNSDEVAHLHESEVPAVFIDAYHPEFSHVIVDDLGGGRRATEFLLSLGHRRIAFVGDYLVQEVNFTASMHDRFNGYREALAKANVPFNPLYHKEGEHSSVEAYRLTRELFQLEQPPTAIFAASDTQAIGVLEAAQDLGLEIPQDLSVLGYDDIEIASYLNLTTMRQALFASGVEGVRLLLASMTAAKPQDPQHLVLPTELVERTTTGRWPAPA